MVGISLTAGPATGRKEHSSLEEFLAMPLQDYLPLASASLQRPRSAWAELPQPWASGKEGLAGLAWVVSLEQPALGGCGSISSPRQLVPSLRRPAQPVGQTGRARLSLNGTLLRLYLCQLGRVGADKCYFGI